jgi:hypothetical protein
MPRAHSVIEFPKLWRLINNNADTSEKYCHFIDGENAIIFVDNTLVRNLQIDRSTVFEQMLTMKEYY